MAGYFKKRRIAGPSKNELKVRREMESERRAHSGGLLSERFPTIERLSIGFEILGPQMQPLGQESRNFGRSDNCRFSVPCPGRCGEGSFNVESKIEVMVTTGETASEASGVCQKPLYAGAAEVCGCQLKCRIQVVYQEQPVQPPVVQPPAA